ncbi:hypothetical protein AXXA_22400 [Achromobacter insuavis AXX-A]|uniref:Uncharacterized protein n=1 Tax=Achromobacter insuavis AXX-A TaxID=1003200 RepID=F7T698_9BURK|nr:hypothetical protein AXXA_22400 [Achromobacter insuavis AXX-A]
MMPISQGPSSTSTPHMASSLGMNDSVISLICVAAWKMLITRPTIRVMISSGPAIASATFIAW